MKVSHIVFDYYTPTRDWDLVSGSACFVLLEVQHFMRKEKSNILILHSFTSALKIDISVCRENEDARKIKRYKRVIYSSL